MGALTPGWLWGEGRLFLDGNQAFDVQNLGVNFGVDTIQGVRGDGGGQIIIPVGSIITARLEFGSLTAEVFNAITGAAAATGTVKRKRSNTLTKSTNDLTIADATYVENTLMVVPTGANKNPLKRVASSPAVGEYTVSSTTITLNASQTEDDFDVTYFYTDAADGSTSRFSQSSLPSSFELWGSMRHKNPYDKTKNDLVFYAANCDRTSEFGLAAGNRDFAAPGFDANIIVSSSGDLDLYWP